jgi:hypothetical protein
VSGFLAFGTVSFLDVINFSLSKCYWCLCHLEQAATIHAAADQSSQVDELFIKAIGVHMLTLEEIVEPMGFHATRGRVGLIRTDIELRQHLPLTNGWAATAIKTLLETVRVDMEPHGFYHYPLDKKKMLEATPAEWRAILGAFPSSESDIVAGVDCHALARDTAAVFHMMRVAEIRT